jgi:hypothetical protein
MMNKNGHPVFLLTQPSGDTVQDMTFGEREHKSSAWGIQQEVTHMKASSIKPVDSP